jgi:tetratricopeptide (TPR) repeat protein
MEVAAKYMAADAGRGAEFFSKWATELSQKPGREFAELRVIALLNLCRMLERMQQTGESKRAREEAISLLEQIGAPGSRLNIQDRLADVLVDFGEYKRAIQSCEQAINLSKDSGAKLANRLWRAGRTYLRAGFKQHAEEPLRKAVEFFRGCNGDPRTPVVLIDLGNALRLSDPVEAERSYREAAEIWEGKGAEAQATVAWVNLGILCGEQERLEESLRWYEQARSVRQNDATTPRARLGSLANNIANLYRRMKKFDDAVREVEAAIALLEGNSALAEAYGTYGLILRDQGLDEASLNWFRRSRAEHAHQPSPNIGALGEVLTNEAAALRRLGLHQKATGLDQQLAELHRDRPSLYEHKVTPVAMAVKQGDNAEGEVLIELDGIHLPESVYRDCDIATLENRLEEVLEMSGLGELDGHEIGPESTVLFLYGADAEALFRAVEPVLLDYPLCRGARLRIRQGDQERRAALPD